MKKAAEQLKKLKEDAHARLKGIASSADLEAWRVEFLGRRGSLPMFLRGLKDLPVDERKVVGKQANTLRQDLEALYGEASQKFAVQVPPTKQEMRAQEESPPGHLHPLTLSLRRARDIFQAMGFLIVEGPEIEEAKLNFDNLNIPFEHPARAETDTFYLKDFPELVLRTHVSTLQTRAVLEHKLKPPFRFMYYGPSYRSEKEDATHGSLFQQYEFMVVEKDINLSNLKAIVETFYSLFFGREMEIRFRPSYFPFVEPGLEVDMRDKVTKKGAWLEMAGAGMVHPNVLRNMNVDPGMYQGIALGGGLDRLAMLKYNIPDLRLLYSGNMRFLKQF